MEYDYDDNAVEFWDIHLGVHAYPQARGFLFEKPTPGTVMARLHFPRMEPYPTGLKPHEYVSLSARCSNRKRMTRIAAEVKRTASESDGGHTVELLLYRKGHEPEGVMIWP